MRFILIGTLISKQSNEKMAFIAYAESHTMQFRDVKCPNFDLSLNLLPSFVYANSKGFGETAHMRSLAKA